MSNLSLAILLVAAIYMAWPPPPLPDVASSHLRRGSFFWFNSKLSGQRHRIFFIDTAGDGPTEQVALLIHGFPISSMDWNRVLPDLRGMFGRIIAADQLGFGFSDKPAFHRYTMDEQAQICEALLEHLGVRAVHVLSHDTGALVGQQMVLRFNARHASLGDKNPVQLRSFTSVNGPLHLSLDNQLALQYVVHLPVIGFALTLFGFDGLYYYNLRAMFGDKDMDSEFKRLGYAMMRHKDGHLAQSGVFHYMQERVLSEAAWEAALRDTHIPVAYIYGPADWFHLRSGFERFKSMVPTAYTAELPAGIGHTPLWEDPAATVEAYRAFVRDRNVL